MGVGVLLGALMGGCKDDYQPPGRPDAGDAGVSPDTGLPDATSGQEPSATQSTVIASPASGLVANGTASSLVTVTVRDLGGNPIAGRPVSLAATGSGNTVTQPSAVTDAAGAATGSVASTVAGSKTVTATVGASLVLTQQPTVTFAAGAPSATQSTVVASPTSGLTANGTALSTITVTVRDEQGNLVAGRAVALAVTGTGNSLVQPPAQTDASGVATGTLASTVAQGKTVTATVDGSVVLSQQPTVTFVAGSPSATQSTVVALPASGITADGAATSAVTVTVRDAQGNPVAGSAVALTATGAGNSLVQPAAQTDASGVATGTLASTVAEAKTVTATVGGSVVLAQQPTVTFVGFVCGTSQVAFTYHGSGVTYGTVASAGRCWLDRNLGAARVATAANDASAFGDLYQWGRLADGHELRSSVTISTISGTDSPGSGGFINALGDPNHDWRNPQNASLWQGATGINNPCPRGWRIPTAGELVAERATWSSNNPAGAFASPLKLPAGGYRNYDLIINTGTTGQYWSSTTAGTLANYLDVTSSANLGTQDRGLGFAVRCTAATIGAQPSAALSTVVASPTLGLVANGVATSTITVTVRDASGAPLPGQAVTLTATGTGNSLVQPTATTNASGVATGTLASTVAGVKTVTASVDGVVLSQQPAVTFAGHSSVICLDGVDDHGTAVGLTSQLVGLRTATLELWFKSTDPSGERELVQLMSSNLPDARAIRFAIGDAAAMNFLTLSGRAIQVAVDARENGGNLNAKGFDIDAALPGFDERAWHHYALVFTGTDERVFIDGVELTVTQQLGGSGAATIADAFPTSFTATGLRVDLHVGWFARTNIRLLAGTIDDVRVSRVARYTGAFTPTLPLAADAQTVASYALTEGSGGQSLDGSGNGFSMAWAGAPAWGACP